MLVTKCKTWKSGNKMRHVRVQRKCLRRGRVVWWCGLMNCLIWYKAAGQSRWILLRRSMLGQSLPGSKVPTDTMGQPQQRTVMDRKKIEPIWKFMEDETSEQGWPAISKEPEGPAYRKIEGSPWYLPRKRSWMTLGRRVSSKQKQQKLGWMWSWVKLEERGSECISFSLCL